ncbi:MAG: hypothetical protein IT473_15855 [Lysobacter sp.]|nr:hypothetical protein [Lysobacter sp.]
MEIATIKLLGSLAAGACTTIGLVADLKGLGADESLRRLKSHFDSAPDALPRYLSVVWRAAAQSVNACIEDVYSHTSFKPYVRGPDEPWRNFVTAHERLRSDRVWKAGDELTERLASALKGAVPLQASALLGERPTYVGELGQAMWAFYRLELERCGYRDDDVPQVIREAFFGERRERGVRSWSEHFAGIIREQLYGETEFSATFRTLGIVRVNEQVDRLMDGVSEISVAVRALNDKIEGNASATGAAATVLADPRYVQGAAIDGGEARARSDSEAGFERFLLSRIVSRVKVGAGKYDLYKLSEPTWSDIAHDVDFVRADTALLMQRLLAPAAECEFIPIVAPSGAGKSTLIRRLAYETSKSGVSQSVYFIDYKAHVNWSENFVAKVVSAHRGEERLYLFVDNASASEIAEFLRVADSIETDAGLTILATFQPVDYKKLGAYRETVLLGDKGKSAYHIPEIAEQELEGLLCFLSERGFDVEKTALLSKSSSFLSVFSIAIEGARLAPRVERMLSIAKANASLERVLLSTALAYSIGVPVPLEMQGRLLAESGLARGLSISDEEFDAVGLLRSDDALRLHHEMIAREMIEQADELALHRAAAALTLSAVDNSKEANSFCRLVFKAMNVRRDHVAVSKYMKFAHFVSTEAEAVEARLRTIRHGGNMLWAVAMLRSMECPSLECLLDEFLVKPQRKGSSIDELFLNELKQRGGAAPQRLLDYIDKRGWSNGGDILPKEGEGKKDVESFYLNSLSRLSFIPAAPGFATLLECMSKLRKFEEIEALLSGDVSWHFHDERVRQFLLEYSLQTNRKDMFVMIFRALKRQDFLSARTKFALRRGALRWDLPLLEFDRDFAHQAEFERALRGRRYEDIPSWHIDPVFQKRIWLWIARECDKGVSGEPINLLTAIYDERALAVSVSTVLCCELIASHFFDRLNALELSAIIDLGIYQADALSMPAVFFWNMRSKAVELFRRDIARTHPNNVNRLISYAVQACKYRVFYKIEEIDMILSWVAARRPDDRFFDDFERCLLSTLRPDDYDAVEAWERLIRDERADHHIQSLYANFLSERLNDHGRSAAVYERLLADVKMHRRTRSRYMNNLGMVFLKKYQAVSDLYFRERAKSMFAEAVRTDKSNAWAKRNLKRVDQL